MKKLVLALSLSAATMTPALADEAHPGEVGAVAEVIGGQTEQKALSGALFYRLLICDSRGLLCHSNLCALA